MNNLNSNSFHSIIGQPVIRHLESYVNWITQGKLESKCWLFVGAPGIGKTASALALATALGCVDEYSGLSHLHCGNLNVASARMLFEGKLQRRTRNGTGMACVILDDLQWLSPECARYLKGALDPLGFLPSNVCVVATAHETGRIEHWLRDRFRLLAFCDGEQFQQACQAHLKTMWLKAAGSEPPIGWTGWGKEVSARTYSMRKGMESFKEALANRAEAVA